MLQLVFAQKALSVPEDQQARQPQCVLLKTTVLADPRTQLSVLWEEQTQELAIRYVVNAQLETLAMLACLKLAKWDITVLNNSK